jgi:hypothetical protein
MQKFDDGTISEVVAPPMDQNQFPAVETAVKYIALHYRPGVFASRFSARSIMEWLGSVFFFQAKELPKGIRACAYYDTKNPRNSKIVPGIILSYKALSARTERLAVDILHELLHILLHDPEHPMGEYDTDHATLTVQCYQALGLNIKDFYSRLWVYEVLERNPRSRKRKK